MSAVTIRAEPRESMIGPSRSAHGRGNQGGLGETDQLLEFVAEAARGLGDASSIAEVLGQCARIPVPRLADLAVAISDAGGSGAIEVAHQSGAGESRLREVVESHRETLMAAARRMGEQYGIDRSRWIPEVTPKALARLAGEDRNVAEALGGLGVSSLLLHPLASHGRVLGVLALARVDGRRPEAHTS